MCEDVHVCVAKSLNLTPPLFHIAAGGVLYAAGKNLLLFIINQTFAVSQSHLYPYQRRSPMYTTAVVIITLCHVLLAVNLLL